MSDPKCPFCGETMVVKTTFFDKFSGRHTAHAKCWPCGAQGPVAKGSSADVTMNRAKKYALRRPLQRPLRWEAIETLPVVWLEDNYKSAVLPAFPEPPAGCDGSFMSFMTKGIKMIHVSKNDYGKRWRAWAALPTMEDRRSTKWM